MGMSTLEFNQFISNLPKTTKVIGEMQDGTAITVEVPAFISNTEESE